MKRLTAICMFAISVAYSSTPQAAAPPQAANLLFNPDFEDGLFSWTVNDPTLVDWEIDHDFAPPKDQGFGAAALFSGGNISQCVPVVPSVTYTASVWMLGGCVNTTIQIGWYDSDACELGMNISSSNVMPISVSNNWQLLKGNLQAPDTAQSARVEFDDASGCKTAVFLDNAFFSDQIFSDSFE